MHKIMMKVMLQSSCTKMVSIKILAAINSMSTEKGGPTCFHCMDLFQ